MKKIMKRNTMKKCLVWALVLVMGFGVTACSGKEEETQAPSEKETVTEVSQDLTTASGQDSQAADSGKLKFDVEPIELVFACNASLSNDSTMAVAIHKYVEELAEWTDGKMVIEIYDGGQLGGDLEMISSLQQGTIDMYWGNPANLVPVVPEFAVFDIGGLYDNAAQCNTVIKEGFMDMIQPYCNGKSLQLVNLFAPMFRELSSNVPVTSAGDLKGLKIRVQENKYHQKFWESLNCSPIPLGMSDLYIGLQQGMVTACENPWGSIWANKLYEVQKYVVETNHLAFVHLFAMNQTKYDSLSDSQKAALAQWLSCIEQYNMEHTAADDEEVKQRCINDYQIDVIACPEDIKALYPAAAQAVVDLMKEELDPAYIDQYIATVERIKGN